MPLKLFQNESFKKQWMELVMQLEIKLLVKLQVSKASPKNNSEMNEELLRKIYILPELRQKIIDDLRLKEENFWWLNIKGRKLIINLLETTANQPPKFRTKNWAEINDDSRGMNNTNSQMKFKTSMLRSSLCDYSDGYILVSGTITITGAANDDAARWLDERNKE